MSRLLLKLLLIFKSLLEFLIQSNPEVTVGAIITVLLAWVFSRELSKTVAEVTVILLTLSTLGYSCMKQTRRLAFERKSTRN